MGEKYVELVADRNMLLGQLHAYAAGADPEVRDAVRRGYGRLVSTVRELTGRRRRDACAASSRWGC